MFSLYNKLKSPHCKICNDICTYYPPECPQAVPVVVAAVVVAAAVAVAAGDIPSTQESSI